MLLFTVCYSEIDSINNRYNLFTEIQYYYNQYSLLLFTEFYSEIDSNNNRYNTIITSTVYY